ncbi:unnamed protein product [Staurois parvus]|uniref:Uncharacterized protein n=1 Tax=Staurois parvus TaxID=386267 RepID=A0ABN9AHU8_9NEOB|nr:unnamed protein product [Staurois parvus]
MSKKTVKEIAELSAGTLFAVCRRDENRPIFFTVPEKSAGFLPIYGLHYIGIS